MVNPQGVFYEAFSDLVSLRTALHASNSETAESCLSQVLNLLSTPTDSTLAVLDQYIPNTHPDLHSKFKTLVETSKANASTQEGLVRLYESFLVQSRIKQILDESCGVAAADDIFKGYIQALQLDNPDSSHTEVMNAIWDLFGKRCDEKTVGKLKTLFAEEEVALDIGLDDETLVDVKIILDDDILYGEVLNTLELHQSSNLPWNEVVGMIEQKVVNQKPECWGELNQVLSVWREMQAIEFLEQAHHIFEDEALYEEFRAALLAEPFLTPEEVFAKIKFGKTVQQPVPNEMEKLVKKLNRLSINRGKF
ncbi:hypothetical protein HK098_004766 [Nowakowskiella sp. JEL0407]|nr:hypothetical protein HK098_004766 [Nowakowskiella sp. JEL0407]